MATWEITFTLPEDGTARFRRYADGDLMAAAKIAERFARRCRFTVTGLAVCAAPDPAVRFLAGGRDDR